MEGKTSSFFLREMEDFFGGIEEFLVLMEYFLIAKLLAGEVIDFEEWNCSENIS